MLVGSPPTQSLDAMPTGNCRRDPSTLRGGDPWLEANTARRTRAETIAIVDRHPVCVEPAVSLSYCNVTLPTARVVSNGHRNGGRGTIAQQVVNLVSLPRRSSEKTSAVLARNAGDQCYVRSHERNRLYARGMR
jgi:hypothetical protein